MLKADRPTRILHVYRTYFPDTQGGLEEALRQICRSTQPYGNEHRIFTLSPNPEPKIIHFPEAEVHRSKLSFDLMSCSVSLCCLEQFKHLVEWADIVHYQFPWPFADILHVLGGVCKPSVVTYQSDIVRQQVLSWGYTPLMKYFLGGMQKIVASSENYARTSKVLNQFKNRVVVVPNCMEDKVGAIDEASVEKVRQNFGEKFFLFVGVLRYYKGLHFLLEALKGAPIRCVVAGKGAMSSRLEAQAKKLGLSNVTFAGYVSDEEKASLYHLCLGVVFPSHLRSEAFGVTLIEGAMYSKPLISCEIGTGTSFVNDHLKTGFVVSPESPDELREAMLKLEKDNELAREMGLAARRRYEEYFLPERVGYEYSELYKSVLKNKVTTVVG